MQFSRYILTEILSVIRNLKCFFQLHLKSLSNDECFLVEHPSFCLYAVFVQFSRYDTLESPSLSESGGLKWTRTTDLALIRRAL